MKKVSHLKVAPIRQGRGQKDQRDMLKSLARRVVDHDFVALVYIGVHHDGAVTSAYAAPSNKNCLALLGGMDIIHHQIKRTYLER